MTVQHTKLFDDERGHGVITDERKRTIATANDPQDARRLVACWNACQGLSTDHLEQYGLPGFAQAISDLRAQRDELLEALREANHLNLLGFDCGDVLSAAIQKATNKEQA